MSFFWDAFFSTLTFILPSHLVTLLLTSCPYLPTNNRPPLLLTYLPLFFHWLNFDPLGKSLYFFLVKPLFLGKTYIFLWLNLYILAKPIYSLSKLLCFLYLLTKLLFLYDKAFIFSWLTPISQQKNSISKLNVIYQQSLFIS
jgi:hypothetical protein